MVPIVVANIDWVAFDDSCMQSISKMVDKNAQHSHSDKFRSKLVKIFTHVIRLSLIASFYLKCAYISYLV